MLEALKSAESEQKQDVTNMSAVLRVGSEQHNVMKTTCGKSGKVMSDTSQNAKWRMKDDRDNTAQYYL